MGTFIEKLRSVQQKTHSLLCIGLDVDPQKLPHHLQKHTGGILEFNRAIIEATSDLVCAYKPNLAFYEALGERGWLILRKTLKLIPWGTITIADGKRGDIGNTAEQYARALFDGLGFDAVTVNPYMGYDSIEPFLRMPEKGVFVLALTSNPGSRDFQRLKVGTMPLYIKVVRKAVTWNTRGNVGLVVGATHPKELRKIRTLAKELPILIPGIGAQGGDLERSVCYGCTDANDLAIVNVSRSILYASQGKDFAEAARREALNLLAIIRKTQETMERKSNDRSGRGIHYGSKYSKHP
ncbi:MAG: orotidine-5'-phosphate decarboxylase [Bacteroidetes bacterium]|nr:orotidine-5'-phosphate decarboxylase [Bacteroidota bacterium]